MVTLFARVVDYRTYWRNNMTSTILAEEGSNLYQEKHQIDGLQSTLRPFKRDPSIGLLSFLATIRDALDTTGASGAVGIRLIAYDLEEEVRDVHE